MKKFKPKKSIVARSLAGHDRLEDSVVSILEKNEYDAYMIVKRSPGWTISCGMLENGPDEKAAIDPVPTVTKSNEKKETVEKPKKKKKWRNK